MRPPISLRNTAVADAEGHGDESGQPHLLDEAHDRVPRTAVGRLRQRPGALHRVGEEPGVRLSIPFRKICTTMLTSAKSSTHDIDAMAKRDDPVGRGEPAFLLADHQPDVRRNAAYQQRAKPTGPDAAVSS
jgi:hypothetical protein